MPNPDGSQTLQERWAADDEFAGELRDQGDSFARPVPGNKARWQENVDSQGDLSAGYGPGARPHRPTDDER